MRQFIVAIIFCSLATIIAIAKDVVLGPPPAAAVHMIEGDRTQLDTIHQSSLIQPAAIHRDGVKTAKR